MKIARVIWHDIHVYEDWHEDLKYKPLRMESVGYIKERKKSVVVIPNVCHKQAQSPKQYFGVVHIPRGCVESIEYLSVSHS